MRILPADSVLFLFNGLLDSAETLHGFFLVTAFAECLLLLFCKAASPGFHESPKGHIRSGDTRPGFSPELFDQNHPVCGPFNQSFVMGYEQDAPGKITNHFFHPFQRFNIDIIGRFVQQKDIRPAQKQSCHLNFDPLTAGQGVHCLVTVEQVRCKVKAFRDSMKF